MHITGSGVLPSGQEKIRSTTTQQSKPNPIFQIPHVHYSSRIDDIRGNCLFSNAQVVICQGLKVPDRCMEMFILSQTNDGDIVATEGSEGVRRLKIGFLSKNIILIGWDNREAYLKGRSCLEEIKRLETKRQVFLDLKKANLKASHSEKKPEQLSAANKNEVYVPIIIDLNELILAKTKEFRAYSEKREISLVITIQNCLEAIKRSPVDAKSTIKRKIFVYLPEMYGSRLITALEDQNVKYVAYTFRRIIAEAIPLPKL